MEELKKWIEENMVMQSCGYYEGIRDINLAQAVALLAYAENVRIIKMAEMLNANKS